MNNPNKMTAMQIQQLIDKYMNGQTTVDEEQLIARYFRYRRARLAEALPRHVRLLGRRHALRHFARV